MQNLPFDLHRTAGVLIILSVIGTILGWGLTQTRAGGDLALFDAAPVIPERPIPADSDKSIALRSSRSGELTAIAPQSIESDPDQTLIAAPTVAGTVPEDSDPDTATVPIGRANLNPMVTLPKPAVTPPIDISDVPTEHWAYPFVMALHQKQMIPNFPEGKFQPDKPVTRAELAAQIQRAFKTTDGQQALSFADIPDHYWAAAAIEQAVKSRFMSGYPERVFRPDQQVPRYEVLVALVSGLGLQPPIGLDERLQRYQDASQLPQWSKGQIAAATQAGIVANHPGSGQLQPNDPATRAEVAVMIHQALVQDGTMQAIASDDGITP